VTNTRRERSFAGTAVTIALIASNEFTIRVEREDGVTLYREVIYRGQPIDVDTNVEHRLAVFMDDVGVDTGTRVIAPHKPRSEGRPEETLL
jgi:hypothetical protein